jgi:DNA-binding response OmpR family regulator
MTAVENVLIAEDDHEDFEILCDAIKELPFEVEINRAENGDVLIQVLNTKIPDLLFLDIVMPCKDGRQCLKEIRADKKFDLLPIVMYSSHRHSSTVEFCFREGANLYTIKPTAFEELKMILVKIFSIEWKKSLYYPPLPSFVINNDQRLF